VTVGLPKLAGSGSGSKWKAGYGSASEGKVAVLRIRDVYPGSRILIFTHPGSRIPDLGSRIPDPKTATKERGEKNFFVKHFFAATNFTKCKIILFLNCSRKKFGPNFKEL
jgi:hypothetical protein